MVIHISKTNRISVYISDMTIIHCSSNRVDYMSSLRCDCCNKIMEITVFVYMLLL